MTDTHLFLNANDKNMEIIQSNLQAKDGADQNNLSEQET